MDDIELGTQITDSMLITKTIGKYGIDASVITAKDAIIGKYAANDIRHSTNLYSDMFVDEWEEVEGVIDTLLKTGDKIITLSLGSGAQSVGGLIRTGSIVDVLTQTDEEPIYDEYGSRIDDDEPEMVLTELLEGVMVYKVLNSALEDISELRRQWISLLEAGDGSESDFDASLTPAFVSLIVSDEQAVELANQEYSGKVHLVLHPDIPDAVDTQEPSGDEQPSEPGIPDDEVINVGQNTEESNLPGSEIN